MHAGSLREKLEQFDEQWAPRIITAVNDQHVKLAKLEGPFDWHHHDGADEFFLVLRGRLVIEFRDADDRRLDEGDFCVVPSGTDHRPVAPDGEAHVLLVEPAATRNTGNLDTDRTVEDPEWI